MKTTILLILMILIFRIDGNAQTPANYDFRSIQFPSKEYGYIVGDTGLVLGTTDAGQTWNKIETGWNVNWQTLFFLSEGVGIIGGDERRILITIDGGAHWTLNDISDLTPTFQINGIYFGGPAEGWVLAIDTLFSGHRGRIYHTQDFASHWTLDAFTNEGYFTDFSFQDISSQGVVVGDTSTRMFYTSIGSVWTKADPIQFPPQPKYRKHAMFGVYFTPPSADFPATAFSCGHGSGITNEPTIYLRTDDGGISWMYLPQNDNDKTFGTALRLYCADPVNGIAIGNTSSGSFVSRTTDGEHFAPVLFNFPTKLRDITGIGTDLWVVGSDCFLGHSTDFGTTWKKISLCQPNIAENMNEPIRFSLEQNYPNPFSSNASTTIRFSLGTEIFSQHSSSLKNIFSLPVNLSIYNFLGQKVATIVDGSFEPGEYSTIFQGKNLPAGMYLYRLTIGDISISKQMMFIK